MFTGIVEELGTIRAVHHAEGGARIEIEASTVLEDATLGASIAVDGCCLTVVQFDDTSWAADAQIETLDRTTLGMLTEGDRVNLERPLRLGDRLGGHIVQGHVDARGSVLARAPLRDGSTRMTIGAPPEILRYVVEKGSITVSGVSLTVAGPPSEGSFDVALVPHTLEVTTLGALAPGDGVNLEVDMIAKYVERLVPPGSRDPEQE